MLKIANQIIDAYDDTSRETLKKLAAVNPDCNLMTPEELQNLRDCDHALSIITKTASKLNKFPIHDKDNTWLSNEFFERTHYCLPEPAARIAASNIKYACLKHNIAPNPSIQKFASKAPVSNYYFEQDGALKSTNVVKQPDLMKFAQVKDIGNNYSIAQGTFKTPSHVKIASEYFDQHYEKMPLEDRHKYAAAVQRRAHELGMPVIKGNIGKYASDYYSPMVDAHLKARISLLEAKPELQGTLKKLGSAKKKIPPAEFAQLLHGLDKKAGLSKYYGSHLTDPYLAAFAYEPDPCAGYNYKTASVNLSGDEIKTAVVAHYNQIKEHFGSSIADELKKDPVPIFESLPNDAKEVIGSIVTGQS